MKTRAQNTAPLILWKENTRDCSSAKGPIAPSGKAHAVVYWQGGGGAQRKAEETQTMIHGQRLPLSGLELDPKL